MKEKDILDVEKLEKDENDDYISENGEPIGCIHCKVHELAFDALKKLQCHGREFVPLCPKCNKPLRRGIPAGYEQMIVSEQNSYVPDGEIGLYNVYYCEECDQEYAAMPIPIMYNGNHGTCYTGGRRFASSDDVRQLCDGIADAVMPSINQYIERKMNPRDFMDKMISIDHVDSWCKGDIESLACNWLYERGLKK